MEDEEDTRWPAFAGIITTLLGVFNIVEGLLTMFNERYGGQYGGYFFFLNLTGWGVLHLLLGLVLTAVGVVLFVGLEFEYSDWASPVAVGLAGASAIFQMIYVNMIPTWSLINVAFAVLIIYALVVKGRGRAALLPPLHVEPVTPEPPPREDDDEHDRP
ncbi:DUF7144 family membrane protein [Allorhizocola rhizosphaerae]|uniref:DUF7144 family membrane protein n=1 Tax=Allorhizocola rhizosphaerae TaxID=1872709 RepID=UPI000E3E0275|nr:hypothetical protein [Allorhizocola rhizosphaerae]